jgi:hypothetical protein
MGSLRSPRLSESAICASYIAGESRFTLCLRARLYDRELVEVLKRNGVPLRSDAEWRAISEARREAYRQRRKLRLAIGPAQVPAEC